MQGWFTHAGREYALWVTDPGYERRYLAKRDDAYTLGPCHLTISLGEPYGDACYKLIARRAYGFHSPDPLISMLFLCCGGIELAPPLPTSI